MRTNWKGVFPAVTTQFKKDQSLDLDATARHLEVLIDSGISGLIMLGSILNYLTRSTLAVAAPTVLEDLHISEQQYSWILGAFQIAIMAQPLCGYVLDVLGQERPRLENHPEPHAITST